MSSKAQDLNNWQPRPLPGSPTLAGRFVTLEPLSALRHTHGLWLDTQGHDEVWAWLGDGPYRSESEFGAALATKESGISARFWAILPKDILSASDHAADQAADQPTAAAAGYASLMRMDPANGVIEVGNVLFAPSLQRTPAATEAMYLMARHVFEELGYRRYEWKCNALNLPSRRAAERLGFTFEGIFRQHMIVKGKNRDTAWFSMLDVEWPKRKQAWEAWLSPDNFDPEGRQGFRLGTIPEGADEAVPR